MGHVIDNAGIHLDPDKVCAIQQLKALTNVTELHRFLGMVTYLSKFTLNLSKKVKSIKDLLSKKISGYGVILNKQLFIKLKISDDPVLALYDPN